MVALCEEVLTVASCHPTLRGGAAAGHCPTADKTVVGGGHPNERNLAKPNNTICRFSPPSLETCDIFTMEPAFGKAPERGAADRCCSMSLSQGSQGGCLGRLPLFFS